MRQVGSSSTTSTRRPTGNWSETASPEFQDTLQLGIDMDFSLTPHAHKEHTNTQFKKSQELQQKNLQISERELIAREFVLQREIKWFRTNSSVLCEIGDMGCVCLNKFFFLWKMFVGFPFMPNCLFLLLRMGLSVECGSSSCVCLLTNPTPASQYQSRENFSFNPYSLVYVRIFPIILLTFIYFHVICRDLYTIT